MDLKFPNVIKWGDKMSIEKSENYGYFSGTITLVSAYIMPMCQKYDNKTCGDSMINSTLKHKSDTLWLLQQFLPSKLCIVS